MPDTLTAERTNSTTDIPGVDGLNTAGLTAKSLIVGVVCTAVVCILVTFAELICSTVRIGYLQLPPVSIAILLVVIALSRALDRVLKRRVGLSSTEATAVYIMCLVGAMVSSHGLVQRWLPLLVVPQYFASPQNGWHSLFGRFTKPWMVPYKVDGPANQPVSTYYYESVPHGGVIPWGAWTTSLFVWGVFLALILFSFLCLTAILRRQWVDNEKLSFPLAQLPFEIIEGRDANGKSFFQNPLVWGGVCIPVAIYGTDWIHQFMPSIPLIPTSISLNDYLVAPYNILSYTPLIFSFAAIGFFFLLPSDILFSIWFFFLLTRAQQIVALQFNMDQSGMPIYPPPLFIGYQSCGAYVVLAIYLFRLALPHLKRVWSDATGVQRYEGATNEMMPYKLAVWGMFGSLMAACLMLTAMGMSLWLSMFELFGFLFIVALVMARSTAEAGMLMTETSFRPVDLYRLVGSVHGLGGANLTVMAFVDNLLMRDQRGLLLTGMLDSVRLGDSARLKRPVVTKSLIFGIIVATAVALPLQLYLPYVYGGLKMDSWMMVGSPEITFNDYQPYFHAVPPLGGGWEPQVFFAVGIVVTLTLSLMRSLFFWWPLHPLGYALAGAWSTVQFWFACFVAWALKSVTLRYGGISLYQRVRPFFLGLIIGEFGMAVLSAALYVMFKLPPPPFPWQ